ncbi:MAG: hypothetical protein BA863_18825 [Desulfovibrio sp. S3730MH75]|nr:MAG: hypothetical protein BA863_18825 [Desulfovibrio sp. S3730MH75]
MQTLTPYILAYIATFFAACSQILLKIGTGKAGFKLVFITLNRQIVLGLTGMFVSLMLSIRALNSLPLREMALILPTVYILVPILSYFFLKEKISKQTTLGTIIIIAGVVISKL